MQKSDEWGEHENFKELSALAQCEALSLRERMALDLHLKDCESCRTAYEEYCTIGDEGMAQILADEELAPEAVVWDNRPAREELMRALGKQVHEPSRTLSVVPAASPARAAGSFLSRKWAIGVMAACLTVGIALTAYKLGEKSRTEMTPAVAQSAPRARVAGANGSGDKQSAALRSVLTMQADQIAKLEQVIAGEREQLDVLKASSNGSLQTIQDLQAASGKKEAAVQQVTAQRDQLAAQLAENQQAYEVLKADYAKLRADHDRSLLHTASLETDFKDLQAKDEDQERRLRDADKYLAADRDIRELMAARKLYIADVFDVDSESRTRKPFGRVFYTQDKSLVFYAYDLEHQPGIQNTSVFQVWGQRDGESNGASKPMNLGVLYMDSESNRRWVLRSDDPKQLAEIDAVFVTVEPHGGSQKPTSKPLLYALLRKEANHP